MRLAQLSLLVFLISPGAFGQAISTQMLPASDLLQPKLESGPPVPGLVVYVSDFDLDVLSVKKPPRAAPRTPSRSTPSRPSTSSSTWSGAPRRTTSSAPAPATSQTSSTSEDAAAEETPADRANALINAVSENLIGALTQAGYDARRLPAGSPLPKAGLRLRGVFAEADERNRARRLLIGGEPVGSSVILFVGVNNLTRPEQPLYLLADPPAPDPRHGPVITVTPYAPAARYEMSREPSDGELKKIALDIAASLTALVNANRLSLAQ